MPTPHVTRRHALALGGAVAAGGVLARSVGAEAAAPPKRVYLATYTESGGNGVAKAHLDAAGGLVIDTWLSTVPQPSWLAVAPDRRTLFAVSELVPAGQVHALRPAAGGDASLLNSQLTGSAPAHVAVHPGGRYLFTSLYGGGAVAVHPIAADGTVGVSVDLRSHGAGSHVHQVVVDPSGRWVLAVDLGANKIVVYSFDAATGRLALAGSQAAAPGAGPRHLVFHPGGRFVYVVNELNSSVAIFGWAGGRLSPGAEVSTLASATGGPNYPGEIAISKDGRFVYVSNRGANTIAVFSTGAGGASVRLVATRTCGGDWPRHLAIDPSGTALYVANQRSNSVVWFPLNAATGIPGAEKGRLAVTAPTQVLFA